MMAEDSESAVNCRRFVIAPRGVAAYIKKGSFLTYRGDKSTKLYQSHKNSRKYKMRRKTPYWNFWKVVFAGWMIRYPDKIFRIIGVPLGILIVMIYNAVTK
jgi:hypothetical protein